MGANEKHAATYHGREYTLDVDDLRDLWVDRKLDPLPRAQGIELVPTVQAEFDRWLEQVRAEAKAEALNEAASGLEDASISPIWCWDKCGDPKCPDDIRVGAATEIQKWLRARANQYKENQ